MNLASKVTRPISCAITKAIQGTSYDNQIELAKPIKLHAEASSTWKSARHATKAPESFTSNAKQPSFSLLIPPSPPPAKQEGSKPGRTGSMYPSRRDDIYSLSSAPAGAAAVFTFGWCRARVVLAPRRAATIAADNSVGTGDKYQSLSPLMVRAIGQRRGVAAPPGSVTTPNPAPAPGTHSYAYPAGLAASAVDGRPQSPDVYRSHLADSTAAPRRRRPRAAPGPVIGCRWEWTGSRDVAGAGAVTP